MSRRGLDATYPHPAQARIPTRPVAPGYSFEAVASRGYPRFPVRPPKALRSPRRLQRLASSRVPAPLDGAGSPRWVSPQTSGADLAPPNAPVAPVHEFRSEEAVVREDSLARHWGCTVLVGRVQNSWQPTDHQAFGTKLEPDWQDPASLNPIMRPAGDGGARSIPKEMVWLHSGSLRYTGANNDLVRHVPEPPAGPSRQAGLQLRGQQSVLSPRGSGTGLRSTGGSARVVLPALEHPKAEAAPEWVAAVLQLHNAARAAHGACPLVWSDECFQLAAAQARRCETDDNLTHGHMDGASGRHGQNAFMDLNGQASAEEAVATWYEEVEDYDWREPGYAGNTGQFSQLVWGETEAVGLARSSDGRYIIANYYPAGNVYAPGEFERNVLPTPDNPNEPATRMELQRLAHLTPRADPPRVVDRAEDYEQVGRRID